MFNLRQQVCGALYVAFFLMNMLIMLKSIANQYSKTHANWPEAPWYSKTFDARDDINDIRCQ
jgi:hypothetical protein